MIRLLTWLITGFWPSRASLHALERRIGTLELRLATLTKKHNSLAGSYYAEFETDEQPAARAATPTAPASGVSEPPASDDFPEELFQQALEERRNLRLSHG